MTVAVEIDERISKCRKILDQDPNSQIFAALAEAYRKKGDLDQAFRVCQNGLKIHPSYGSAHVVMGKINLDRGLYDWAEAEVKKAVVLDGSSRAVDLLLAEIHIYQGEYRSAVRLLKRLHQVDPGNEQIKKLLDIALKLPEQQAAASRAAQAPKVIPAAATPAGEPSESARSEALRAVDVLRQALALPELDGALFVNSEGLVVESEGTFDLDTSICGAAFAETHNHLSRELARASFGKGRAVLVETGDRLFYLVKAADGMFLFVGGPNTNLGGLRMRIETLIMRYGVT